MMDKRTELELTTEQNCSDVGLNESQVIKRKLNENESRIFKEFVSNSTLHGLHYIFDRRPTYQRLLWLLVMMLMFGLFVWQASMLMTSYIQYKVTTRMQIAYNREIEFPVITICNENMYKKSVINGTDLDKLIKQIHPLNGDRQRANWTAYTNLSNINMNKVIRSAAHKLRYDSSTESGMLYRCRWKEQKCYYNNFTEVMTEMGLCYQFNAVGENSHLVSGPGNRYGLRLTMSVEQKEYLGHVTFSSGLRILVHNKSEPPSVRDFGFAVMPRSHVYAAISKHRVISLPAPYETMCEDKKIPGIETYTKSACHVDCMEHFILRRCGCRAFFMKDQSHPLCNISSHFECVEENKELFDHEGIRDCDCTEPCDMTFYTTYLSYGQFPSYEGIQAYLNNPDDLWKFENNLIAIDLYFQKLDYHIVEQVPIYDAGSLFGELGGLLGLFLGASIITLNEILDFLFQVVCSRFVKN